MNSNPLTSPRPPITHAQASTLLTLLDSLIFDPYSILPKPGISEYIWPYTELNYNPPNTSFSARRIQRFPDHYYDIENDTFDFNSFNYLCLELLKDTNIWNQPPEYKYCYLFCPIGTYCISNSCRISPDLLISAIKSALSTYTTKITIQQPNNKYERPQS